MIHGDACFAYFNKIWGIPPNEDESHLNFKSAQSMHDIVRKLLQSIGFREPEDVSIARAVEANDAFVDALQRIKQDAQALTIEQT